MSKTKFDASLITKQDPWRARHSEHYCYPVLIDKGRQITSLRPAWVTFEFWFQLRLHINRRNFIKKIFKDICPSWRTWALELIESNKRQHMPIPKFITIEFKTCQLANKRMRGKSHSSESCLEIKAQVTCSETQPCGLSACPMYVQTRVCASRTLRKPGTEGTSGSQHFHSRTGGRAWRITRGSQDS